MNFWKKHEPPLLYLLPADRPEFFPKYLHAPHTESIRYYMGVGIDGKFHAKFSYFFYFFTQIWNMEYENGHKHLPTMVTVEKKVCLSLLFI